MFSLENLPYHSFHPSLYTVTSYKFLDQSSYHTPNFLPLYVCPHRIMYFGQFFGPAVRIFTHNISGTVTQLAHHRNATSLTVT